MSNTNGITYPMGKKVIIRASDSGVHYGTLVGMDTNQPNMTVQLKDSRRLWRWSVAGEGISLTEVSITGINQAESRITAVLPDLVVSDVCEIIPAMEMAIATIESAPVSKAE